MLRMFGLGEGSPLEIGWGVAENEGSGQTADVSNVLKTRSHPNDGTIARGSSDAICTGVVEFQRRRTQEGNGKSFAFRIP